ncbi:hypothetical protein [Hyphomonas sp. ND6WE1B]|uniref:hypothetical protein n=1 Tax=Hyphomonas sp. ND6WE1B TaxID=1848191 RepID=UPI0008076A05|nr:hypothetical protein [Hyphomonas sp. ND6WE1B]
MLTIKELAEQLTTAQLSESQAYHRLKRLKTADAIKPMARFNEGATSPWLYAPYAPAIIKVLFHLYDMGISEPDELKDMWEGLASPQGKSDKPRILEILEDIRTGGQPKIVRCVFLAPDGHTITLSTVRLTDEYEKPIELSEALELPEGIERSDYIVASDLVINADVLLSQFIAGETH